MDVSRYDRVRRLLARLGARPYRYEQFTRALFSKGVDDIEQITTLPSTLRRAIADEIGGGVVALSADAIDRDDQATKVRFRLPDGLAIEAVHLRYRAGWTSLCISSQAGCGYGCTFCATASLGLQRQLSIDEITDQVLWFRQRNRHVGRVAFMGMGEPLANPRVVDALDVLVDPALFGYSPRRITVSTVGLMPGLERLLARHPDVGLTFSLHAADGEVRRRLVPLQDRFPADEVLARLDRHVRATGRQVTVACALIDGVNDRDQDVDALVRLLRGRGDATKRYHVNLYPLNPSPEVDGGLRPSPRVRAVRARLRAAGLHASIRAQFGRSIAAGCGQLAGAAKEGPTGAFGRRPVSLPVMVPIQSQTTDPGGRQ
jgi:23S rRNA (adenine-C8)-methyltransferase